MMVRLVVSMALASHWMKGEIAAIFFVWLFPVLATLIAIYTDLQIGFLTALVQLSVTLRRALTDLPPSRPSHADPPDHVRSRNAL